ncbi:MAG: hypothetical protein JSS31_17040 [Proteobacteria bacterium]|nr:hypothetical protein [Pseudomonadota bacterium]MBS0495610.1 hypothetical protein [Pseudomonadota bacterium]
MYANQILGSTPGDLIRASELVSLGQLSAGFVHERIYSPVTMRVGGQPLLAMENEAAPFFAEGLKNHVSHIHVASVQGYCFQRWESRGLGAGSIAVAGRSAAAHARGRALQRVGDLEARLDS